MSQTKVLLVEDTDSDALLISRHLRADGRFSLQRVETLANAVTALQNGVAPGVIILDLNLPDSTGLETFHTLHSRSPATPIVILSGLEDEELAIASLKDGAQDYVPKAMISDAVLVRSLLYAVERNARLLAERRFSRIETDLATAHKIQGHLLPAAPPAIAGLDIAAYCEPAESCAGDFYDFIQLGDEHLDVLIADVSGHGFAPAIIMAGTRRILRSSAVMYNNLGDILTIANHAVAEDTLSDQFVTLFYLRLNLTTRSFQYSTAGHPAWLVSHDDRTTLLSPENIPLGLLSEREYQQDGVGQLHSGDVIVMMTDGVWEACNPDGELFGRDRVFELITQHRQSGARVILDAVIDSVRRYCHPAQLQDDVTLVLMKGEGV